MTYYGIKSYNQFFVARTLLPANQVIGYSNVDDIADVVYRSEDNSSVTFAEGTSNTSLVGTVANSGELIFPKTVLGNKPYTFVLQTGNNTVESIAIKTFRNLPITNVQVVNINGSYMLPPNTFALVAEGTVQLTGASNTNVTLVANQDLYVIGRRVNEFELSGNGRLVTFNITI